jgi:hypothetical protein
MASGLSIVLHSQIGFLLAAACVVFVPMCPKPVSTAALSPVFIVGQDRQLCGSGFGLAWATC